MFIKNKIKAMIKLIQKKQYIPIPEYINSSKILDGKIALITGGSGGIGFEMAKEFINQGAKVIITGRDEEKLKKCVDELNKKSNDKLILAKYIVLELDKVNTFSEKVDKIVDLFEEKRIDILVNSAGQVSKSDFWNVTEKEFDDIMNTNIKGLYFFSREIGNHMIKRNIKGHILNVSSSSSLRPAWSPYQLSKWALKGFTLGLADLFLPYGIIVNSIAPGGVATQMLGKDGTDIYEECYPSKRYAMPSEIAKLAAFMVSDMGNLIVGSTYYITGGSGNLDLHN